MAEQQESKARALVAAAGAGVTGPMCAKGHPLTIGPCVGRFGCDDCHNIYGKDTPSASCRVCDSDVCGKCWQKRAAEARAQVEVAAVDDPRYPSGAGAPTVIEYSGRKAVNWRRVRELMPVDRSDASVARRNELFKMADPNSNGYLSLAEVDKAMRDVFQIDAIYNMKPVMLRAFNAVKGLNQGREAIGNLHKLMDGAKSRGIKLDPAEYIEKSEFRALLCYLQGYTKMMQVFDMIDTNQDRRLSRDEFRAAQGLLKKVGLPAENPDALFSTMDADAGGMVLFEEFSNYMLVNQLVHNLEIEGDYA